MEILARSPSSAGSRRCSRAASLWTWSRPNRPSIAQEAGAVAVMALERIPGRHSCGRRRRADEQPRSDSRHHGCGHDSGHGESAHRPFRRGASAATARRRLHRRIGSAHARRRQVSLSTSTTFTTPFVCGARDLGEALRRIAEGAAMIRSKGEAGSGNIVEAVRHMRAIARRDSRADASFRKKSSSRARAISARRSNSFAKLRRTASCRSCSSARAASRRRPTPR